MAQKIFKSKKEFEKWAFPLLKKYQKILLTEDHTLDLKYDPKMSKESLMEHNFNYPYKTTVIRYSDHTFDDKDTKKELERCLIHELCHTLTDPLYNYGFDRFVTKETLNNERERLTDHIANIIVKLFKI